MDGKGCGVAENFVADLYIFVLGKKKDCFGILLWLGRNFYCKCWDWAENLLFIGTNNTIPENSEAEVFRI